MPVAHWAERETLCKCKCKNYREQTFQEVPIPTFHKPPYHPSSPPSKPLHLPQMFGIQFDAAGIYLVGTPTHQFHVSFEELMSTTGGIIGLLEYGLTWKVIHAILSRIRHRIWQNSRTSLETPPPLWIDNSGPALYEVRHGLDSIRVSPQELESSRFGRTIKEFWDRGMSDLSTRWVVKMVVEAFFIGIWKGVLRKIRVRSF